MIFIFKVFRLYKINKIVDNNTFNKKTILGFCGSSLDFLGWERDELI